MLLDKEELRVVFMGTPDFAVPSLKAIYDSGYSIAAVVTAPDRASGRGRKLNQSPVKQFTLGHDIPVLQPEKLKNKEFLATLEALNAHLFVVVAFRMLPEEVWAMPPMGTFNLHGSLLPQYRGAAPINHAIMNGEEQTGLTTFFLDSKIDTGRIIMSVALEIGQEDSFGSLHDKMMNLGANLVTETIEQIRTDNFNTLAQDQFLTASKTLKSAPKIFKEDCRINWQKPTVHIYNFIRALDPFPAAFTNLISPDKKTYYIKVFKSKQELTKHQLQVGSIVTDAKTYIKVAVPDGYIYILELQVAGKKRLLVESLLKGFPISEEWQVEMDSKGP